jgi:glycosyltransferase involved in cell wall biosynthesis
LSRLAWAVDSLLALLMVLRRWPDLVYVNSSAASIYLRPALLLRRSTLLHVHESGPLVAEFLGRARVPVRLPGVALVACGASVHRALCQLSGRPSSAVALIPSVPDEIQVRTLADEPPDLPYDPAEFVVGCCGSVEYRKGPSLWVDVARRVRAALPGRALRFVWIGEVHGKVPGAQEAGAEFVGPRANPYAHMRHFGLATLPSRDDPFPLVVLESMAVGTPVVAFDVGSVALQVGDAGVVVTPGDVAGFADAVVRLILDDEERTRLGASSRARVDEQYPIHRFRACLAAVVQAAVL